MKKNTRNIYNLNIKKLRTLAITLFVFLTSFSTLVHVSKSTTVLAVDIKSCNTTPPEQKISFNNPKIPRTWGTNSSSIIGPNTPNIPTGPSTRLMRESGMYSTNAVDPDNDTVQYQFDWNAGGAHEYSGWTSLVASGQSVNVSHSWNSTGTYLVCAQARDEHGSVSAWSTGLTVTVTRGKEMVDQASTRYDNANSIWSTHWCAQSFTPSLKVLKKVTLYIGKMGSPSSDLVVSVRSSLNGADLTSVVKSSGSIPSRISWVVCDFKDISVTPGRTYYLVVRTSGGTSVVSYMWGYGKNNPYPNGSFRMSTNAGSSWIKYAAYDFCFQTYGQGGGNSPPNAPAIPSGPISRIVGESGMYSTSVVDPDGDQVQYRFDWDAGGTHEYSGWTTLVPSDQSVNMSHSWSNAGTYLVRTQAKDKYGNEGPWSNNLTVTVTVSNSPPYVPSNPNPGNHTTDVFVNADLSWTGGDPNGDNVTYDVYFGTTASLPKVSANQSSTTYDTGTMNSGTIYYWKIVSWDEHKISTAGPIWDFTTGAVSNNPPNTPSVPTGPATRLVGVSGMYSTSAVDPDDDQVQYQFDWNAGDTHEYSGWTTLVPSDQSVNMSHSWSNAGTYLVRTQAKDKYGNEGPWSNNLTVTVTVSNSPPYVPSNPNPGNHTTDVFVNADLSWTGGDPNGDNVTYDVYFGTTNPPPKFASNQTATSFNPGLMNYTTQYYWKIIAWDNYNSSTPGPLWNFTTVPPGTNNPPNQPTNPYPTNNTTEVNLNPELSWSGGDPDNGDTVTYDIYFGTTTSSGKVASNQSNATYTPGTLQYITHYYWKIIAWDNHGLSQTGPLWSFTTKTSSSSGGGGTTKNIPPVADLSAGEPYRGIVGENIIFDGSKSHDPDGKIISWYWTFGDKTNSTEKNVTRHTYTYAGLFIVKLTVTDNQGATNTKITNVTITTPNRPPSQPTLVGPRTGAINTSYTYTATSTDLDNSALTYTFDWGDTTSNLTPALPSGTPMLVNHTWTSAGVYLITVTASDGVAASSTSITVLISVEYIGDIGYLIDHNGDGTYDGFYSNTTKNETKVEEQANGTFYINTNGDRYWDYIYDPQTKKLTLYPIKDEGTTQNDRSLMILGGILGIIVALVLLILLVTRKKKNKPTQSSAQGIESEKPVVKTQTSKKPTTKRPRKKTKK